jgi:hypothetical protein
MKQAFVIVLAVGLLVGGAQGVALAQNAGAPSVPQGSQGYGLPVPSYPPDAYRPMDTLELASRVDGGREDRSGRPFPQDPDPG